VANYVLIDVLYVSVFVPRGIENKESDQINRTLHSRRFQTELMRTIRSVFRRYRLLGTARVTVRR
jgi:hypothetical protein